MAKLTDQQSMELFAINSVRWDGKSDEYDKLEKLAKKLLGQGKSWDSVKTQIRSEIRSGVN